MTGVSGKIHSFNGDKKESCVCVCKRRRETPTQISTYGTRTLINYFNRRHNLCSLCTLDLTITMIRIAWEDRWQRQDNRKQKIFLFVHWDCAPWQVHRFTRALRHLHQVPAAWQEKRTNLQRLLSETEHTNNFQDVYPTESCSKPMLNFFVNRAAKTVRTCWHETAGRTFHPYLSTTNHVPPPRASQVIHLCHMRLVLKLDIARGGAASRKINKINTQKPSTFDRFRC